MMEVPVPDLLQISHPGYRLVVGRPNLEESDCMTIVDYAKRMTERFEHYGRIDITSPQIFELMEESFGILLNDDDPQIVLPVREFLPRLLEEYESMTDNMVKVFPLNQNIRAVYQDLSELLYEIYDCLIGGESFD